MSFTWTRQPLAPLDILVGPCAWRLSMLAGPHADYVADHPSLIVVDVDDDDALLRAAAPRLGSLPLMLNLREPSFARRLPEVLRPRLDALGRKHVEILTLWVEDVADLKGGSLLQILRAMQGEKVIGHIGLGHHDVRNVEWLALHTPARALVMPFDLADQSARYRAVATATEYGMARIAAASPVDEAGLRFALAASNLVLPVLDAPIPDGLTPLTEQELDRVWEQFQAGHAAPAPLPRGQPPD